MCHLVRLAGGRLFRHSGMHFKHYLPARRLTWEYLCGLLYASGRVSVKLDAYRLSEAASIWPAWMLRSSWLQLSNVCLQTLRYRVSLGRKDRRALEGDDRVAQWEIYRGRLDALWSHRRDYRNMVTRHGGLIAVSRQTGPA